MIICGLGCIRDGVVSEIGNASFVVLPPLSTMAAARAVVAVKAANSAAMGAVAALVGTMVVGAGVVAPRQRVNGGGF